MIVCVEWCYQVESVRATAAGKETELISKLEDYGLQIQDRDQLNEQVLQLQKELQVAKTEIAEQVSHHDSFFFFFFLYSVNKLYITERTCCYNQVELLGLYQQSIQFNFLGRCLQQKEKDSQKEFEREDSLKRSLQDLEAKGKEILALETQIKDLQQKLLLAEAKPIEKVRLLSYIQS